MFLRTIGGATSYDPRGRSEATLPGPIGPGPHRPRGHITHMYLTKGAVIMPEVGIRELLEAGVHFGHQTRRWNPKMRRFIHGERGGIYIIDLLQTQRLLEQARQFAGELAQRGGVVLFVGTKKQARDAIKDVAEAAGMPYVNHRWLGGLLTNFQTINQRIRRLHDLERYETEGQLGLLPTRERMAAEADLGKLRANLGGVKYMQRTPDAMFVIDLKTELIAVREAQRLRIPIIGLVDTNCDPDGIDFVIPGNDDAIKSCAVVAHAIGEAARDGRLAFAAQRAEEEERVRREAEERARREAEEQARRDAEAAEAAAAAAAAAEADRAAQEAAEAQAVAAEGRPQPDPEAAVTQKAQTEQVQADVAHPAPPATDPTPDPASPPASEVEAEGRGTTADAEAQTEPAPEPAPEPAENATQEQNA
jgi:small subunit ribosomal protein S2